MEISQVDCAVIIVGSLIKRKLGNLLDQPILIPIGFFVFIWFQDAGNEDILIFLLTKSPGDVTIKAVIANHLFPLVGDVGGHGHQPI